MGYRQLMGESKYRSWKDWKAGDAVEGTLTGTSVDQFGKNNYAMKVIECDFAKKADNVEVGKVLTLNANGALDHAMNKGQINIGDTFKVIYKGEDILTKGKFKGKKFHKLEVLVKDEGGVAQETETADDDLLG